MSARGLRLSISAAAHAARDAAYELEDALNKLEAADSEGALDLEDATLIILAFYNRARALGWTTAEMTEAREFLRQYAPQEVW